MAGGEAHSLSRIEILRPLKEVAVEEISRRCTWRRYRANEQILTHLDDDDRVFFIVEGRVRVVVYSPEGKEVIYRDIDAGQLFGELAAIDGAPRSANVVAVMDTLVAAIGAEAFRGLLGEHPEVTYELLRQFTGQVRALTGRIFEFSALAVRNRIHAELLRLADERDDAANTATISPAPKHAEIASRISTHREAVTREINDLARAGVVEKRNGALLVTDLARLEQMVEYPHGL